jgi:hypothetical protein
LIGDKIYLIDLAWPGPNLPAEALMAGALVVAGPRTPLGPEREQALMNYVTGGGKLLLLQDPMVAGFDPAAIGIFGLDIPRGLMVDPETAWAGTEDRFIVGRDFPAHPITMSLDGPVIWPLSGAITLVDPERSPELDEDIPLLRLVPEDEPESELAPEPVQSNLEAHPSEAPSSEAPPSEEAPILHHTWVVAISSDASWLETDLSSIADGSHRYQPGEDKNGPLVLSTATSVNGGGRLALAADSDLAANGFINYGGNLAFLTNTLFWLMGAEDDLPTSGGQGVSLTINHNKAQLLFWIPSVFWPLLVLLVWYVHYRRRRRL